MNESSALEVGNEMEPIEEVRHMVINKPFWMLIHFSITHIFLMDTLYFCVDMNKGHFFFIMQ